MKFALALVTLLPLFVKGADIPVAVGQTGLTFEPSSVTAAEGDVIVFSFYPKNHTVTQSSFAAPCTKLVDDDGPDDDDAVADSGFVPVTDASTPTVWNYTVTSDDPTWFYCAQASPVNHCTGGMVFAINPSAERTFEAFQQNARNGGTGSSSTTGTGTASPTNTSPGGSTTSSQATNTAAAGGNGNGAVSVVASGGAASLLAIAGVVAAFAL
ncbi:hypothetical protein FA13DRAFT_1749435 [Coprinellus micaceus]|uniref:Cupredoxin n=1 Tax=Coprinellus micaceus TaxID=71717 RepID=A0A4Y7RLT4_COPMI|nr:hypothetical protein FA13DRAFT_1749435 [Coprinellus micaceus]